MFDFFLNILDPQALGGGPNIEYLSMPLHQFKWLIILSALALHGVISVILGELMGRSYGKSFLWFAFAFLFPIVGPVIIWIYHLTLSSFVTGARKQTFWERLLTGGPVSLVRVLLKEQARAKEVKLHDYKVSPQIHRKNGNDAEIDELIARNDFGSARAHAWKIIEVARETRDVSTVAKYQEYLETIAEKESITVGRDAGT